MEEDKILELAKYISSSFKKKSIIPDELLKKIATITGKDSKKSYHIFLNTWDKSGLSEYSDINQPLIISRGFKDKLTTEEQLASFLPEEKILINQDLFRTHLESLDLVTLSSSEQQRVIQILNRESIGLSNSDVLLYYNLIKINQLSNKSDKLDSNSSQISNRDFAGEIFDLTIKAFNLNTLNIKKVNSGRDLDRKEVLKVINESIEKKRINPYVLSICLGYKKKKFLDFFIGFMSFMIEQRGDEIQPVLTYVAFYILFNSANPKLIGSVDLSSNVEAFVNDRIGRVKSVYYVAMLFAHTFNVLLTAQMFEISSKYHSSSIDQRLKLEKLYSAENRRALLVNNAIGIATRKISSFKNESMEVLSAFKRFSGNTKAMISVKDLFENDWSK